MRGRTINDARHLPAALRLVAILAITLPLGSPAGGANVVATIAIDTRSVMPIHGDLYGVNYDWNYIAGREYKDYVGRLRAVTHFTLQRFPSGWNAERYDWSSNRESAWSKQPLDQGASAADVIATSAAVTFITPSRQSLSDGGTVQEDVEQTLQIVQTYGSRIKTWEIGNEWWLQQGAKTNASARDRVLHAYAGLVAAIVPKMVAMSPDAKIYVSGDWLHPEGLAQIRAIVGQKTWALVKGVSIHIYCGDDDQEHSCTRIEPQLVAVRAASGKSDVYVSEWDVALRYTRNREPLPHANEVGIAIGRMAAAGVGLAAYWPPARILPTAALVSADFGAAEATGALFGWLAEGFRGSAVRATGDLPAIAASSDRSLEVFVFSRDQSRHEVTVKLPRDLPPMTLRARVMYSESADGASVPHVTELPVDGGSDGDGRNVSFVLNPSTPRRGSGWEIARLSFAYAARKKE